MTIKQNWVTVTKHHYKVLNPGFTKACVSQLLLGNSTLPSEALQSNDNIPWWCNSIDYVFSCCLIGCKSLCLKSSRRALRAAVTCNKHSSFGLPLCWEAIAALFSQHLFNVKLASVWNHLQQAVGHVTDCRHCSVHLQTVLKTLQTAVQDVIACSRRRHKTIHGI